MKIHGGARATIDHGAAWEFKDRDGREDNHDAGRGKDCSRVHNGTSEVENHEAELGELENPSGAKVWRAQAQPNAQKSVVEPGE